MAFTQEQIAKIRADAGAPPLPKMPSNAVSLSTRLGIRDAKPQSGFVADVSRDLEGRGQQIQESYTRELQGKQSKLGTAVDTAGAVAGGVFDVAVEGVKTVNRALGGLPGKALTQLPGPIHSAKEALQTPQGQATISKIGETYEKVKEAHPAGVQHAGAITNIAMLAPIGLGAKVGGQATGEALQGTGKALQMSASKSLNKFAQDLVKPEQSKAVRISEVGRTKEKGVGPFKGSIVDPTRQEKASAAAVAEIPGINPRATNQQNYNIIKEYNTELAQKLQNDLQANDFIFPKKELMARLNDVKAKMADNPSLVGDSAKTAEKLVAQFQKLVDEAPAKGSSLLRVRKKFDDVVESQKGDKVFDPKNETAFTIALRDIRRAANDFLDEKATNVAVKDSLHKQSALFNALDNIAPKAATEANTAFMRAMQRIGEKIGTKNRLVQFIAAGVGIGGLGAAATFAPAVAAIGVPVFGAYHLGKFVLNPRIRNSVGRLLETAGNAINPADRQILHDAYYGKLGQSEANQAIKKNAPIDNSAQSSINPIDPSVAPKSTPVNPPHTGESGFIKNPFVKPQNQKVTIFRGEGEGNKGGNFYTFDKERAKTFGPNVKETTIDLSDPLVLDLTKGNTIPAKIADSIERHIQEIGKTGKIPSDEQALQPLWDSGYKAVIINDHMEGVPNILFNPIVKNPSLDNVSTIKVMPKN